MNPLSYICAKKFPLGAGMKPALCNFPDKRIEKLFRHQQKYYFADITFSRNFLSEHPSIYINTFRDMTKMYQEDPAWNSS